jgi:hypothetical protein
MIKHIAYLNDNYMQIKINNQVKEFKSSGIAYGQIISKDKFISDFAKKIKILNFWSTTMSLYLNKDITEEDNIYYKMIFDELNYVKLTLLSTKNKLNNNTIIVNKDRYILYSNSNYIYIDKPLLNNYLEELKIAKIKVIGPKLDNMAKNIKLYYFDNYNNYFLS